MDRRSADQFLVARWAQALALFQTVAPVGGGGLGKLFPLEQHTGDLWQHTLGALADRGGRSDPTWLNLVFTPAMNRPRSRRASGRKDDMVCVRPSSGDYNILNYVARQNISHSELPIQVGTVRIIAVNRPRSGASGDTRGPSLVHTFWPAMEQSRRSAACGRPKPGIVSQVRF